MVRHACDMLKAFLAKMKGFFRLPERTESQEAFIEAFQLLDLFSQSFSYWSVQSELQLLGLFSPELQLLGLFSPELQLMDLFSPELQLLSLFSPELQLLGLLSPELQLLDLFSPELQLLDLFSPELQLDLFSLSTGSEESFAIETEAVQNIIIKEFCGIEEPLLDNMKDTEIEVLKSDTSEWINNISAEIVRSIIEETNSLEAVAENLFERVWAKVEGEDFKITTATFKTIDKLVYKELCHQWDGATRVLVKARAIMKPFRRSPAAAWTI
ncbi:hypothetical protein KUCAC02_020509 [Chaenocephalus aceratus]|nr:hypothetical protein KUCAC02_020509 [Chaenocephalus aceratus]